MKQCGLTSQSETPEPEGMTAILPLGWAARHKIFFEGRASLFLDGFVDLEEGSGIRAQGSDEKDLGNRLMH